MFSFSACILVKNQNTTRAKNPLAPQFISAILHGSLVQLLFTHTHRLTDDNTLDQHALISWMLNEFAGESRYHHAVPVYLLKNIKYMDVIVNIISFTVWGFSSLNDIFKRIPAFMDYHSILPCCCKLLPFLVFFFFFFPWEEVKSFGATPLLPWPLWDPQRHDWVRSKLWCVAEQASRRSPISTARCRKSKTLCFCVLFKTFSFDSFVK